jgi:two-component system chemotaxis response regulator CheB
VGTVYIAPPDRHLCVRAEGKPELTEEPTVKYARPAADPMFESAAKAYGSKIIACVLTGSDATAPGVERRVILQTEDHERPHGERGVAPR